MRTHRLPTSKLSASFARARAALAGMLLTLAVATGCTTLGGETVYTAPDGSAASLADVLDALDAQQNALHTLHATRVSFILDTERSDATFSGRGDVTYQRPDALHVTARHRTSGAIVLRMTVNGSDAAMSYGVGGDRGEAAWRDGILVAGEPTPFTPWEVAHEVFQPEAWGQLPRRAVRVSAPYDPETGSMVLVIGPPGAERRIVNVSGPPWRIVENHLLGPEGPVARTTLGEHRDFDGILVPTDIRADFYGERSSLVIRLTRDPQLNQPVDMRVFALDERP
jgi:hypothetical protein